MTTRIGFHDLPLEVRQDIITRFVKDCIVEGFEGLNSSMTAQLQQDINEADEEAELQRREEYMIPLQQSIDQGCAKLELFPIRDCAQPLQHCHSNLKEICMQVKYPMPLYKVKSDMKGRKSSGRRMGAAKKFRLNMFYAFERPAREFLQANIEKMGIEVLPPSPDEG